MSDAESVHVVVVGGAGFYHKGADETLPSNLKIMRLPACSSELNQAKTLWGMQ